MYVDPKFRTASEAAEQSLEFLVCADMLLAQRKPNEARKCLEGVAVLAMSELSNVIRQMGEDLAGVAGDMPIRRHGPVEPYYYASAHEAVTSVWTRVDYILAADVPLPEHTLLDWLGVNPSALRAGLVRERARLLGQESPRDKRGNFPVGKKRSTNNKRDAFIYKEMKAGRNLAGIKVKVNEHKEWYLIDTDQGISQAAKRYAERTKKPWPLKS